MQSIGLEMTAAHGSHFDIPQGVDPKQQPVSIGHHCYDPQTQPERLHPACKFSSGFPGRSPHDAPYSMIFQFFGQAFQTHDHLVEFVRSKQLKPLEKLNLSRAYFCAAFECNRFFQNCSCFANFENY